MGGHLVSALTVAVLSVTFADPECTLDAETGCKLTCDGSVYDLSKFQKQKANVHGVEPGAGWYTVINSQHKYYFNGCGPVTGLKCEGSDATSPVSFQTWGDPYPDPPNFPENSCAVIGDEGSASCTLNGTNGIRCNYGGGDAGRSVMFQYNCADVQGDSPTATQPDPTSSNYLITFSGPAACVSAPAGGLSWGSLFLILAPIFSGLYVAAGYYYNYKYKELRGMEAVPQIEYWKEVPGLVKDGCKFSYKQTRTFIAYLQEKHSGAPADPALKQALANDEDGAASTSYEENKA